MRIFLVTSFFIFFALQSNAQVKEPTTTISEQQLENITENNADAEIEDDSYLQQMQQYLKDPINLNSIGEDRLKDLLVLTPLQIQNFILYQISSENW